MKVRAYGKINLALDVLGQRSDGYHEIDTIMQEIDWYDEILIEKGGTGLALAVEPGDLVIEDNLIERAWQLIQARTGRQLPMRVVLRKNLPLGAGLGGGSADAAYFIQACRDLWDLDLGPEDLWQLAKDLGADVFYFFQGGTVRARGIGNELEALADFSGRPLVLVNDGTFISTAQVYEKVQPSNQSGMEGLVQALDQGNYYQLASRAYNVMERVVFRDHPHLALIKSRLENLGADLALMSGSGSTLFGLFSSVEKRDQAYERLRGDYALVKATETRGRHGSRDI